MNKTYAAKPLEVERQWVVIDAKDQILGRLATEIVKRLRGKHIPQFTPHTDAGQFVVILNAKDVAVSGNKRKAKLYQRHTGRPGGFREKTFEQMIDQFPERVIEHAVWGMLPKNRLSRQLMTKLKVYSGSEHPHAAQQPEVLSFVSKP
jgi:large subunit ribosomal protein L13